MCGTIAKLVTDHLAEIADTEHDLRQTLGAQQLDLVVQERASGHFHERLRNFFRDRAQPRGEAAGEDGDSQSGV